MNSLLLYKDAQLVMGIFITSSFPTDSYILVSISQLGLYKSLNARLDG